MKTVITQEEIENIPRWEAHLNNGLIVYSDNQYIDDKSDWERLVEYCHSNNISVNQFCIAFRDHKVFLDNNSRYYFRRMFLGDFSGFGKEYFVIGCGLPGQITIYKYTLPELISDESEPRIVTEEDLL